MNKNWIPCKDGNYCLPKEWFCDGLKDCVDGSDEENCVKFDSNLRITTIAITRKIATSSTFLPTSNPLDNISKNVQECTEDEFQCENGSCISSRWVCDGLNDCIDASDERDCEAKSESNNSEFESTSPNSAQPSIEAEVNVCEADQFKCKFETYCIPDRWVCDKQIDCKDGSDESDCNPNKINF